jgi:hypothetical protein
VESKDRIAERNRSDWKEWKARIAMATALGLVRAYSCMNKRPHPRGESRQVHPIVADVRRRTNSTPYATLRG